MSGKWFSEEEIFVEKLKRGGKKSFPIEKVDFEGKMEEKRRQ